MYTYVYETILFQYSRNHLLRTVSKPPIQDFKYKRELYITFVSEKLICLCVYSFMEMNEEKMIWRSKVYDEHNLKLLQMITIGQGYAF